MPRKTASKHTARAATARAGRVRVIAGQWRGRVIGFDDESGLRPTGDRIRETLFNWLQAKSPASRCLDLYAGSGALGIEAASRGAQHVTLVDSNARVVARLRAEVSKLGADNIVVEHARALEFLNQPGSAGGQGEPRRFDIVFIDPPFDDASQLEALNRCVEAGVLRDGAVIYVEAPLAGAIEENLPGNIAVLKSARSGSVQFLLLACAEARPD